MTLYHKILGQGPDLVLLHGFGFQSDIWSSLATPLSTQYTVHGYDLPGFGRSQSVPLKSRLTEVLEDLLPHLPLNANYIGWSLGGLITAALAYHHPSRVRSFVTIGSSPCFLEQENWKGVSLDFFNSFCKKMLDDPQKSFKKFLRLILATRKDQEKFHTFLLEKLYAYGIPSSATLMAGLELLKNSDLREALHALNCPSLHIAGQCDPLVKDNLNVSYLRIEGAGHIPFLTHETQVLRPIEKFFHECA